MIVWIPCEISISSVVWAPACIRTLPGFRPALGISLSARSRLALRVSPSALIRIKFVVAPFWFLQSPLLKEWGFVLWIVRTVGAQSLLPGSIGFPASNSGSIFVNDGSADFVRFLGHVFCWAGYSSGGLKTVSIVRVLPQGALTGGLEFGIQFSLTPRFASGMGLVFWTLLWWHARWILRICFFLPGLGLLEWAAWKLWDTNPDFWASIRPTKVLVEAESNGLIIEAPSALFRLVGSPPTHHPALSYPYKHSCLTPKACSLGPPPPSMLTAMAGVAIMYQLSLFSTFIKPYNLW